MKIAQLQFVPWEKIYNFLPNDQILAVGDKVIAKTDLGMEMAVIVGFLDIDEQEYKKYLIDEDSGKAKEETQKNETDKEPAGINKIIRLATPADLEKLPRPEDKQTALDYCKQMKEKHKLAMKFIDVHFSFDGSRITFAFIADGRIDFRELVKDLTRHFGRTIRLQQIGIRDEAKIMGDFGHCGRPLCCKKFLSELSSITSEMADIQQCSHRGSERISGICGRLMCCLAYEEAGYEQMAKYFPPLGTKVSHEGKRGIIVGHHILKQTVVVKFFSKNGEESTRVEIDLGGRKK